LLNTGFDTVLEHVVPLIKEAQKTKGKSGTDKLHHVLSALSEKGVDVGLNTHVIKLIELIIGVVKDDEIQKLFKNKCCFL
jgi:hypothetical protein